MSDDPIIRKYKPIENLLGKKALNHKVYRFDEKHFLIKGTCPGTKKEWELIVLESAYRDWAAGTLIHKAFPALSQDQREMIISGYTKEGWDTLFPPEQEEE